MSVRFDAICHCKMGSTSYLSGGLRRGPSGPQRPTSHPIGAPTYHEVPVAHTSTQIVARRSAAPVLVVAPSKTTALRPSYIAPPRGGRPRVTSTGRCARVVLRRACGPPQTPQARADLCAGRRSPSSRRCTPTARKPAPTITRRPVVPRRPRPPASRMTPRSAARRAAHLLARPTGRQARPQRYPR